MKNDRPDLFSNLEFAHYYQLNSTPETMLTTKQENYDPSPSSAVGNRQTSEKSIMIALGFIATLLMCSGMQLYRSVNLVPAKAQTITPNQALTLDTQKLPTEIPLQELGFLTNEREIEILSLQNAISQGKY